MKTKRFFLYLIIFIMALASCTTEEQPPTISYVFSDVSSEAGETSVVITCHNESVDDDKVFASVLLSKNENITDATKYPLKLKNDILSSTINGLERNTMYFFCFEVYTINEHKRTDEVHHFRTLGGSDVLVTTSEAINITQTGATGGGNVTVNGDFTVSMRGVCWDTVHNPNALQSPHLTSGEGTGTFLLNITGLKSNTTYYMKAYALSGDVVYYGNEVSFTTLQGQAPTVVTGEVTNITRTTAMGSGDVADDGGATVTQRGVCWSTGHNPTINGSHVDSSTGGTGAFTAVMTGLSQNTTYYVRAYAKNAKGISYGEEVEFKTTQDVSSPTVTTSAVTNITQTSAKGHGNVTADGGAAVTERGVCWGTGHNPTISGSHASSGTGTGSFSVDMTGLSAGTTYYVRAYAKNSVGTAYSEEVTFVTTSSKPTVTTDEVSNITQTTAKGGGNVTDDGGTAVTSRGICWSTSHNPTTTSSHATGGTGTGSYTVNMTGLTQNTTYYVRAYAINSQGTSYGSEVSFTTSQNVSAPTVTTGTVTNVTPTSAKCSGNVTSDGGATVTERGVCWSTSHNPTTSNSHAYGGTGTGNFTCDLTGLSPGTIYYVRAYAKNSQGTSYGSEVSFSTTANLPTVTTSGISNITQTTAIGGGNVTSDGGATVTQRGVCWSTSHNPTTSSSHTTDGTGTGSFTSSITGLSLNTTYYVRAYATNSAGTAYGSEMSFSTLSGGGGMQYVDLGLPSGLLWATCNVGANAPEEYGQYFAWGETVEKDYYDEINYQHCMGSLNALTKYCYDSSYGYNGFTDDLTTLLPEDDAATANWGAGWRIPTQMEWHELLINTTNIWTTRNGVNGRLFTALNGNSIFLPAGGWFADELYDVDIIGFYWSSSLPAFPSPPDSGRNFSVSSYGVGEDSNYRSIGFTVRAVRSAP